MEKTEKMLIKLPEHEAFLTKVNEDLQEYEISYKSFSDIWEFKSKDVKHSIWYNGSKPSKIKTEKNKQYRELIIVNSLLFASMLVLVYLKIRMVLGIDVFFIFGFLFPISNAILFKFKPKYKTEFEQKHKKMIDYISQFKTDMELPAEK